MPLVCLVVGKKHESWVAEGIQRYESRLKPPYKVEWVLLPHSGSSGTAARLDESERIQKQLRSDDVVVLLDERGKPLTCHTLIEWWW